MDGIALNTRETGDASIIEVRGYLDTTTASNLEEQLQAMAAEGKTLQLLDLSRVDYVSSAGWGVFISVVRALRERGGDLKLVGMQNDVHEVFELLEFRSILESFSSVDEALAAVAP